METPIMFGSKPLESSAKTVLVRHFALLERDGRVMGRRSIPTLEGLVVQNRMRNHDIHDFLGTFVFDKPAVLKKPFSKLLGLYANLLRCFCLKVDWIKGPAGQLKYLVMLQLLLLSDVARSHPITKTA